MITEDYQPSLKRRATFKPFWFLGLPQRCTPSIPLKDREQRGERILGYLFINLLGFCVINFEILP